MPTVHLTPRSFTARVHVDLRDAAIEADRHEYRRWSVRAKLRRADLSDAQRKKYAVRADVSAVQAYLREEMRVLRADMKRRILSEILEILP